MFDILTCWNKADPLIYTMATLKSAHTFINNGKNNLTQCARKNCDSCNYDFQKAARILGIRLM